MAQVKLQNINLGGLADSNYLGSENSVAEMVGFDIHSEGGLLRVNQALTKESGATIDDLVKAKVQCSDGNTYLFGSTNGKIWKRTSGGTYSLEATASPASGSAGIKDAYEYQGYIYYAMQNRLGRVAVGAPTAWSGRSDNWATFTNGSDHHPMKAVNLVLYIGDANLVAQVDAGTFSANALDIKAPLIIKSLGRLKTDLLIGTFVTTSIYRTEILRWNTWSVSYSTSDEIPEVGVNSFLDIDNQVIVNAGLKGNLYQYDGFSLQPIKSIKGDFPTGTTNQVEVFPNATFNFAGLPLFGLSQVNGNGAKYGVYSFGRKNINYPRVLNLEWLVSVGNETNIKIGSITGVGDIFLVAWEDVDGSTYGVDKLDLSNKFDGAYITTRRMMADRNVLLQHGLVYVAYKELPSGTAINIEHSSNHASFTSVDDTTDAITKIVSADYDLGEATVEQVRIRTTASGNDAPEIEMITVEIDTE